VLVSNFLLCLSAAELGVIWLSRFSAGSRWKLTYGVRWKMASRWKINIVCAPDDEIAMQTTYRVEVGVGSVPVVSKYRVRMANIKACL
jgi:hypothetical protein